MSQMMEELLNLIFAYRIKFIQILNCIRKQTVFGCFRTVKARTNRMKNCFYARAIIALN